MAKNYEELDFSDAFMFGKVMEDEKLCHDFLSRLMGRDVGVLTKVEREKEVRITSDGKSIRLDICTKDEFDNIYDAEMQNLNHETIKSLDLPKRTRFYQSVIDNDVLSKGNHYSRLPESTIIFICTFDPFECGKYMYSFREICDQNPELHLNDGTVSIFFNASVVNTKDTPDIDNIPDGIRKLFEYIMKRKVSDDLTTDIEKSVTHIRKNSRLRGEYMREISILMDAKLEGYNEGIEQGIKQGIEQGKKMELAKLERAEKRAKEAENRIKELEALLEKNAPTQR